jgi:DNA-binding transcriptional LysR family regulator
VRAGLGKSLLPLGLADAEPGLRRIDDHRAPGMPVREIWLLTHADQRPLARVGAVIQWLESCARRLEPRN